MPRRSRTEKPITPLELKIMKVLWALGPSNVQAVQEALPSPLAYTTVQTMLNVLVRKGRATRNLRGRAYEYEATLTREKAVTSAVRDIVDRMFGGSVDDLLMTLVKTKQLDARKLAKLKELIDEKR